VTLLWDEEGGPEAARATDDVVVPSCYALDTVSRGMVTDPPWLTAASTQTPREEPGPVTAPPCSTTSQQPPTVTVTAEAATQWQDPDRTPPCPPGRPLMSTVDMVAMARPFWLMPVRESAPQAASALLQTYSTSLEHRDIVANMQWAHMGRRDLVHFLLHRMTGESREGRTAEQILQSMWCILSNMQR